MTNCDFENNGTHGEGGGVYVKTAINGPEPTFTNCTFPDNNANKGGGFYSGVGRSPSLLTCPFTTHPVRAPDPHPTVRAVR